MTYFQSAKGITITRARARQELGKHGALSEWPDFVRDLGDRDTYDAQAVLRWLGY